MSGDTSSSSGCSSSSGEDSDKETRKKVCTVKHEITNGK